MGAKSRFWQTETGKKLLASGMFLGVFLVVLACPARADTNITNCTNTNVSGETYLLTADILDADIVNYDPARYNCFDLVNNTIFDCQGYTVDGIDDTLNGVLGFSIYPNGKNITIRNCIVTDWGDAAIGIYNGEDMIIENTSADSSVYGINIPTGTSKNILISNSSASDNDLDGIFIGIGSLNITIENSTFSNSTNALGDGIGLDGNDGIIKNSIIKDNNRYGIGDMNSTGNAIFNNLMNNSDNYGYDDYIGTNSWNTTRQNGTRIYSNGTEIGGNYWTNSTGNGYSDTCTDLLQDGFCDDPYDVNTSAACAAVADGLPACGNNTDWLPLSAFYVEPPCQPSWNCTDWSACVRGYQTRECTDDNQCGDNRTKPVESQVCFVGLPNATFNITDSCCPISQYYCTDNETLVQLWNTSEGVSWAVAECNYGCDNATSACSPAPYEANLWTLAIIIGIIVGIALLYRWSKR